MKKFLFTVLSISVFFIGLGSVVEKVGAHFKSDQKALDLIKAARTAIGGDSAIAGIQSLRIKGNTVNSWKMDGAEKTEPGETEIAIQLPDKVSKTVRIGNPGDDAGARSVQKRETTLVVNTTGENGEVRLGQGRGQGTGAGAPQQMRVVVLDNGEQEPGEPNAGGERTVVLRKTAGDDSGANVENRQVRLTANKEAKPEPKS